MSRTTNRSTQRSAPAAPPFAWSTLLVLLGGATFLVPALPAAEPKVASTGLIDLSIEPPIPTIAIPIVIGPDEKPVLVDGKATSTSYVLFSFKPPANRMFELRLFAPESDVAMTIYRGAAKSPVPGAGPADGAIMWMSSSANGEELRILVRGQVAGETPFKVGARLYPKSSGEE